MSEHEEDASKLQRALGFLHERFPTMLPALKLPSINDWPMIQRWHADKIRAYTEVVEAMIRLQEAGTALDLAKFRYDNRQILADIMLAEMEYARAEAKARAVSLLDRRKIRVSLFLSLPSWRTK